MWRYRWLMPSRRRFLVSSFAVREALHRLNMFKRLYHSRLSMLIIIYSQSMLDVSVNWEALIWEKHLFSLTAKHRAEFWNVGLSEKSRSLFVKQVQDQQAHQLRSCKTIAILGKLLQYHLRFFVAVVCVFAHTTRCFNFYEHSYPFARCSHVLTVHDVIDNPGRTWEPINGWSN